MTDARGWYRRAMVVLCALLAGIPVCASDDLLVNGDLSQGAGDRPANWGINLHKAEAAYIAGADGGKAVRLRAETIDGDSNIAQDRRGLSIPKGTMLHLSAVYRTRNFLAGDNPACHVYFKFNYHAAVNRFGFALPLPPAEQWTPIEATFPATHDITDFRALVQFVRCRGDLEIDRVSLRTVTGQDQMMLFSLKKDAPVIDGDLNDPCWQAAQRAVGFIKLGKLEPASTDTQVVSCYDDQKLYFGVRLDEPHLDKLRAVPDTIWRGDCVEIFLDPVVEGNRFFQLIVDCEANVLIMRHESGSAVRLPSSMALKTGRTDGAWTVELAVPWDALETTLPDDNQHWVFSVGRERHATSPSEFSAWVPLGRFVERSKFGRLAFYSRHEVVADMAYWRNNDRDPRMRRPVVSGYAIAKEFSGEKPEPSIWSTDPFAADREKHAAWQCYGLVGETATRYPAFYETAMGINRTLVDRMKTADLLIQYERAAHYATADTKQDFNAPLKAIDRQLDGIFKAYGQAFDDDWNEAKLTGLDKRIAALQADVTNLTHQIATSLKALANRTRQHQPWTYDATPLSASDKRLNADGASDRIVQTGMRFWGHEPIFRLLGDFESVNCDWPQGLAGVHAPGEYTHEHVDAFFKRLNDHGIVRRGNFQATFGLGYMMPFPAWLQEAAKTDPDILIQTQDGLATGQPKRWGDGRFVRSAVNPNNPKVLAFAEDYLTKWAAYVGANDRAHFFITGWEDSLHIHATTESGEQNRSLGYNPSHKTAFRDYLKKRYESIDELNRRWGTDYVSFQAIEPPNDKFINPPSHVTGLTYEFERWSRVNHAQWAAKLRGFLKQGSPQTPVMIDNSHLLGDMNGYLMLKENAVDIVSYHSNPGTEDAMWAQLGSLCRRYGKPMAYYENYWGMYRLSHITNEHLAANDVRRFFYQMLMRDIRTPTWWLRYAGHATEYLVAYGGGAFIFDYDQTILRPSTAQLAPMFERTRRMEKAILNSRPIKPTVALVQPCSSVFALASMGYTHHSSPSITTMMEMHNRAFEPWNQAYDLLPEEMVLDGDASLDDYQLLVLPYALHMTEAFAQRIKVWTHAGGTLVTVGPFALFDPCGKDLPADASVLRSLFPAIKRVGDGEWDYQLEKDVDTQPSITSRPVGKGRLIYLNRPIGVYARNASMIAPLKEALVDRPVTADHKDMRVLLRDADDGSRYACIANRNTEEPIRSSVSVAGSYTGALDIVVPGGFAVPTVVEAGRTTMDVSLAPGDFTMIRLTP